MPIDSSLQTTDPPTPNNTKRMSISLSGDIVELLEFLAEHQGITQNEAIRRAIATDGARRVSSGANHLHPARCLGTGKKCDPARWA